MQEYLTLDPTGAYLAEQGRGWRLEGPAYHLWRRESDGRWSSRGLPLAFSVEGVQVAVFTAAGRRLLREGEVERTLREQRLAFEVRERRAAEALVEQERVHAQELAHLRRRLEELERGR